MKGARSTTESHWALVVGASRGLGLGLAAELKSRGWNVVATVRDRARDGPGIVAFMSSGLGSVADKTDSSSDLYSASKAALNSLSRSFAASLGGRRITVLAVAPGWVRTDMGGPDAPLSVEESVHGIVDVLESRAGTGRHGFVDYQGHEVAW
jgi:NAD(P)-dependent dehydrogenase (short-subunit alcohol dehydrogenase family)